jgi:hypothetical protein
MISEDLGLFAGRAGADPQTLQIDLPASATWGSEGAARGSDLGPAARVPMQVPA